MKPDELIFKVRKYLRKPGLMLPLLASRGFLKGMDDATFLRRWYKDYFGKDLNLDDPKGFNEKIQWLKLYDRNPEYVDMVDKISAKKWVANRIGETFIVPTLAIWETVDVIDTDSLPDRFVLKTNHDNGGVVICESKASFDLVKAKAKLKKHLSQNYYYVGREWPYKNIEPRIFAEEFIDDGATDCSGSCGFVDYKFLCFNGEPRLMFTCSGRAQNDLRVDFFDMSWNLQPFTRHYPNSDIIPDKPAHFEEMKKAAEVLSEGIPFVRVDFYDTPSGPLFGEMTFYPGSGFEEFEPSEWDDILGSWIDLSLVCDH